MRATLLKTPDQNNLLTVVQKKAEVIPLLSEQEKTILDTLAKIFVTTIIKKSDETGYRLHKNFG
jgi:hypothetical protein